MKPTLLYFNVFQKIEIYYDKGRPINCIVNNAEIENTRFSGIIFRNITARAGMKSQFKDKGAGNTMDVTLENVVVNCVKVDERNLDSWVNDSVSFTDTSPKK